MGLSGYWPQDGGAAAGVCLCTCSQSGKCGDNKIQMTREGRGWSRRQEGGGKVIGSELGEGAGQGGVGAACTGLFSPNGQGFIMKMSALVGIFQNPDADLLLPASPTPPSLVQTESGDSDTKDCSPAAQAPTGKAGVAGSTCRVATSTEHRAQPAQSQIPLCPPGCRRQAHTLWHSRVLASMHGRPGALVGKGVSEAVSDALREKQNKSLWR